MAPPGSTPTIDRETVHGLLTASELVAKMLIAGDDVRSTAGEELFRHVILVRKSFGEVDARQRVPPDRRALEHAVAQELDDAGDAGLTVADAVDRLWTDFADHYAHRASLRKAIYEVLSTRVEDGTARGAGVGKSGQGARYYAAAIEEGARRAASQ